MGKQTYVYYQPNDKDLKDQYGDCSIRALSKALGVSWLEAWDAVMPLCRKHQLLTWYYAIPDTETNIMGELGFKRGIITNKKGTKRPTVKQFALDHPTGTYICKVAHHVVAVVDGKYYDTWDCGDRPLYTYYERTV